MGLDEVRRTGRAGDQLWRRRPGSDRSLGENRCTRTHIHAGYRPLLPGNVRRDGCHDEALRTSHGSLHSGCRRPCEAGRVHGPNLFYESMEKRKACCAVRKTIPCACTKRPRCVGTGLRREQSITRTQTQAIEWDELHGIYKISPLHDWTEEQVWTYIRTRNVPYNALHDKGFPSIGCAPCTRAVASGEDARAGRWWWEQPEHRECGLHSGRPRQS